MIDQLKSGDKDKQVDACTQLGDAGPHAAAAVPALIESLQTSKDSLVRTLSAYALGRIGEKAKPAIPALKEAMQSGDVSLVPAAVNAIRFIDPSQAPNAMVPNVSGQSAE
jgi:HEAT repeat protein